MSNKVINNSKVASVKVHTTHLRTKGPPHAIFNTFRNPQAFTKEFLQDTMMGRKTFREKRGKFYNSDSIKKGTSSTKQNS